MEPARKKKKRATGDWPIVTIAAAFTVAEALVSAGVELPGSTTLTPAMRVAMYTVVMGGGFIFKWWASKKIGSAQ